MSPPDVNTLPAGIRPGGRFADWEPAVTAYVVADVDGTLVGVDAHASDEVAGAVADAVAAGLAVGFATGRMRLAVDRLWDQLRAPGPHILHNGAEVRAEGHTIASWPLTSGQLQLVFEIVRRLGAYAEIYVESGYHVTARPARARPHWEMLGHEPLGVVSSAAEVPGPVPKVTFAVFEGEDPDRIVRALEAGGLAAGPAGSPLTPDISYVNATHPEADKGVALRAAASHLGVELGAVAAIGDAPNDLSMLALAGTSIAMGQAPRTVQEASHLVVPAVGDHGAARALAFLTSRVLGDGASVG